MSRTYTYPTIALRGDYFRAATGVILCAVPLAVGVDNPVTAAVLAGIAALFATFGVRTLLRNLRQVEVSEHGIRVVGPGGKDIAWSELSGLSVAYFSTWRSRGNGWMELRLDGAGNRLRLESNLEGFETVARHAAAEAASRGIEMNDATLRNLSTLGAAVTPMSTRTAGFTR